ncbi:MAG TPA: DNA phosphorothioation system sulfurtransferase DndC [Candidatus Eisenbacteria bacterium]|nr:DNA phosphorothioation system sulfurtransferase DndC [Candidatus Eisenbacteria bacterium]
MDFRETKLSGEILQDRYDEIRNVYLSDQRPWVIGYSGGKDSTTALQLIWYALSDLPKERLTKRVYIIASDTLVETPQIVNYIDASLHRMNAAAQQQGLPFSAHKVRPKVEDSFWVNLIGRGYPAPSQRFRWCTDRLKIDPANRFILDKVAEHGEVIVILGVRTSESATRAQVMSLHRIKGSLLSRHSSLPNAFVYTPIEDFSTADVWAYLLQAPSPWGNRNLDLVTLYRNAQAGECPLVVDRTTPSCGNSRFGCWVCTVVTKNNSMEAMIENGEDWLRPMLDYRELLASTQDPAVKAQLREHKRRTGQVLMKRGGVGIVYGPYKLDVRKNLLRKLLQVQKEVRAAGPNSQEQLIREEELHLIRRIWRLEAQDWEDSVPKIYRDVMGEDLDWPVDEQVTFSADERATLDAICERHEVPPTLVAKLLDIEREYHGMSRRSSIHQRIAAALQEDWRSEEEIFAQDSEHSA